LFKRQYWQNHAQQNHFKEIIYQLTACGFDCDCYTVASEMPVWMTSLVRWKAKRHTAFRSQSRYCAKEKRCRLSVAAALQNFYRQAH
jgi:hypothetical protein